MGTSSSSLRRIEAVGPVDWETVYSLPSYDTTDHFNAIIKVLEDPVFIELKQQAEQDFCAYRKEKFPKERWVYWGLTRPGCAHGPTGIDKVDYQRFANAPWQQEYRKLKTQKNERFGESFGGYYNWCSLSKTEFEHLKPYPHFVYPILNESPSDTSPETIYRFQYETITKFPVTSTGGTDKKHLPLLDFYEEKANEQELPHVFPELRGLFYMRMRNESIGPLQFPYFEVMRDRVQEVFFKKIFQQLYLIDFKTRIGVTSLQM